MLRSSRLVLWTALLAVAAFAWALTVRRATAVSAGPTSCPVQEFLAVWTLMMAAMMLPAVAPVAALYASSLRTQASGSRVVRSLALAGGYLVAWAAFGVAAFALAWGGRRLADDQPGAVPWVAGSLLVAAGIYQLTPLKDRCLSHCRSPLGFLMRFASFRGPLRDVRVGVYHGGYCVGCCWGLMVALIVLGMMDVAWMVVLAGVVLLEKTWRHGKGFALAFGIVLIALGCVIPWYPDIAGGLHPTMAMR